MFDYLMNMCELFDKVETIEDLKKEFNENSSKILEEIKLFKAKKGRATYYDGKEIGHDDPGCVLFSLWLDYILNKKL